MQIKFFGFPNFKKQKISTKNPGKKIKTVRLSSNPSFSEVEQDVSFESDKIQKIQNFK